jgi:hypothetical protein
MSTSKYILAGVSTVALMASCSESTPEQSAVESGEIGTATGDLPTGACTSPPGIEALCGPRNAEDIVRLGDSQWLLASGMNGALFGTDDPGTLHLINHETRAFDELFPGDNPVLRQESERFADCPGPVDVSNMSFHGLALSETALNEYELYVTSHGAREAIEVFAIDATTTPSVTWIGCVPMPSDSFTNSVVILDDGGFFATKFMDPVAGIESVFAGGPTGYVFEWHPGGQVEIVPGTELAGANGIEISEDQRWLYVAAFGQREIIRFDLSVRPVVRETLALDVTPDNLRWSPPGTLLTAGGRGNGNGWAVVEIDPSSWTAREIAGVNEHVDGLEDASVAFQVADEIWVGSYSGDRLVILDN